MNFKEHNNQQLARMTEFMDQEAEQIVQDINDMAEEEYHIQKGELIHKGIEAIKQAYNKKMVRIDREKATMIPTHMTKAKLEILLNRDEYIKSVLAAVNEELVELRKDQNSHKPILKKLILQAMYQMLERKIDLIVIPTDVNMVKSMIGELQKDYLVGTGLNVDINIDNCLKLSEQEIGGVMVTTQKRRKFVDNTLVMRLIYLAIQAVPLIRSGLFGPKPTRKHQYTDL
ncbi:V-type proton ATPase subunit E-like [Adelges cooleyi]|uniref:V-type proton ATPase subunit E-like n=1 Tax=Adelges cooleyi TaxID=133065 RepID=UPI0021803055|nr:V-type proton ATPase subunit E-like [Adelges cooleyi]